VLRTKRWPVWLAWVAIVGGLLCLGTATVGLIRSNQDALVIPFAIGSVLVTIWALGAGWMLWRNSSNAPTGPRPRPGHGCLGITPL
jgi:hypothetical protein